jgi:hypothetical protein
MKDNKIACAGSTLGGKIWIPPKGRPFWTVHNSRGNAIGHLYDEELDKYGLSYYKKFPFNDRKEGTPIRKINK